MIRMKGQMSEHILTMGLLSVSGGLQDVYTYLFRGNVFANAQTGNVVLMSVCMINGDWDRAVRYLIPLLAFSFGIAAAAFLRRNFRYLHWRQVVLLLEILLLFAAGCMPQERNLLANSLISFSCAMQVQAFRKVQGFPFSSTMCIGNLRSGMEAICIYLQTRRKEERFRFITYLFILLSFAVGAGLGGIAVPYLGAYSIWLSSGLLGISFCIMFFSDDLDSRIRK